MKRKHKEGFSLIELIVTVSLVSVISAGGMAAYNKFTERQRIVNAGKEIEALFREAQKKAQSGDKPEDPCDDETTLESWEVVLSSSNKSAVLNVVCNEGGMPISHKQKSVNLSSDIQTQPTTITVKFEVLTGRPEVPGGNATILLGTNLDSESSAKNTLVITASGGIQNQGYKQADEAQGHVE